MAKSIKVKLMAIAQLFAPCSVMHLNIIAVVGSGCQEYQP